MHAVAETRLTIPHPAEAARTLLFIVGHTGQVGAALRAQLDALKTSGNENANNNLHLVGCANRSELLLNDPDRPWTTSRIALGTHDWQQIIQHLKDIPARNRLFVDCTAEADVAQLYPALFAADIGVITPNKLAHSGPQHTWETLHRAAREHGVAFHYETSVGAALPVLEPLRDLVRRGDRVLRIEAILSGTLSFIFQRVNCGVRFSEAMLEARTRGYTEPHPAGDLTGRDCARKLLILLRTAGLQWEPERVPTENLLPTALADESDAERLLAALAEHDDAWAQRADAARRRSLRLAYLARFDGRRAEVGVTHVAANEPFALLAPGENLVRIWSTHYDPVPLSIAGPGAGPALTAAGILTDLIKAAR